MALTIIGLILFAITIVLLYRKIDEHWINLVRLVTFLLSFFFLGLALINSLEKENEMKYEEGYKDGQIDMLRGNEKYYMNLKYEKIDGEFIPTDTLFVGIDECSCP